MQADNTAPLPYTFRVEGVEEQQTFLPTERPFDETYEIEGEHPVEALMKLVNGEIEWGILDSDRGFTITFLPAEGDDGEA